MIQQANPRLRAGPANALPVMALAGLGLLMSLPACRDFDLRDGYYSCYPGVVGSCPSGMSCRWSREAGEYRCFLHPPGDAHVPACGNGDVDPGEECDGVNLDGATCQSLNFPGGELACTSICTYDKSGCDPPLTCGDGQIQPPEDCDGANLNGETCESLGFLGGTLLCSQSCGFDVSNCVSTVCGDGVVGTGEECDDGNQQGQDGCSAVCSIEAGWDCSGEPTVCVEICGDGLIVGSEGCDDGNLDNTDDCPDDPAGGGTCQAAGCGDGHLWAGNEVCDDGNNDGADGCSADCLSDETCGNSIVDAAVGETCDDGANNGLYGYCLADCSAMGPVCGDETSGTWGTETVDGTPNNAGNYSAIAIGHDDLPAIAYLNSSTGYATVAKCGDPLCIASNAVITPLDRGVWISIAIGTDGCPVVAYQDSGFTGLGVAKCGTFDCSSGNVVTAVYDNGNTGKTTSISIGTDGRPFVAFRSASQSALFRCKCSDAACAGSTSVALITTGLGSNGQRLDGTIGADGNPVIAYHHTGVNALYVAKCANTSCSVGTQLYSVDTGGVGQSPSIVIGPDNNPVISYYDLSNANLKLVKCGNPSCSAGNTIRTVASTDSVGNYNDLALRGGLPVISYYNATAAALMVAKCATVDCSGNTTFEVADPGPAVGTWTAIAVDSTGTIHVSYRDGGNAALKHACQAP